MTIPYKAKIGCASLLDYVPTSNHLSRQDNQEVEPPLSSQGSRVVLPLNNPEVSNIKDVDSVSKGQYRQLKQKGLLASHESYVMRKVQAAGLFGLTSHELAGLTKHRQDYAPRLTDLMKKGFLEKFKRECVCGCQQTLNAYRKRTE